MCNVEGPPLKKRGPCPLPEAEPYPIYLDYNATTPLCDEAWQAMVGVHTVWGNPSSSHPFGLAAKFALERARDKVKTALHAPSSESIIFTSGGTESNNLAIIGGATAVHKRDKRRRCIVSTNVEHPAVAEVLKFLHASTGTRFEFHLVPVDPKTGAVDPATFEAELNEKIPGGPKSVALVTIMFANNELGSVNPIGELVGLTKRLCGEACYFHSDAAQSLGKVPVDLQGNAPVDLLSVCGHKFYGPKGAGALYIKPGVALENLLHGAGHERGIRPGTENVLFAAGMAEALSFACANISSFAGKMRAARQELYDTLKVELAAHHMDFTVNGDMAVALPNTLNCAMFKKEPNERTGQAVTYISAARLIVTVGDQVCMSAGSACHSTAGDEEEIEVSTPLQAVGVDLERAIGTLRLSTGRDTTLAEARRAARIIARHAAHQFAET